MEHRWISALGDDDNGFDDFPDDDNDFNDDDSNEND